MSYFNPYYDSNVSCTKEPLFITGPENCRYDCMQSMTDKAIQEGIPISQYFGKWPFYQLFGIQEPASVIFSIGNFCVHFYYFWILLFSVPSISHYQLKGFMILYSVIGMHAWIWCTLFHTRNTKVTEMMNYFSAGLLVLYTFYFTLLRVFQIRNGSIIRGLGTLFICLFVAHVGYLIIVAFNYVYNMYVNIVLGGCHILLWIGWYVMIRLQKKEDVVVSRPYAHLVVISCVGVALAMCFLELFDFPPLWRVFDAHSLWHLSTVPLFILWYRFLVEDMYYETTLIQPFSIKLLPA